MSYLDWLKSVDLRKLEEQQEMNEIEKAIRIYDIPENRKTCFNNENMTISIMEKVVTNYVEKMEDHVCESIIKCLPDDVTKVLFLDKNKITEIFKKQIPIKPTFHSDCITCGNCWGEIKAVWKCCPNCTTLIDW